MTNISKSPLSIGGFSGPERVSAGIQGTISAFMVSNKPGTTGSMVTMKVHSVAAGNINADLISGPCLSLDGYGTDLPPQGAELLHMNQPVYSRNKDHVDGLYKSTEYIRKFSDLSLPEQPLHEEKEVKKHMKV